LRAREGDESDRYFIHD